MSLGVELSRLRRADGADVYFWAVVPLYADELAFKLRAGTDALTDAFDRARITHVVKRDRPSALTSGKKPGWWPFGAAEYPL